METVTDVLYENSESGLAGKEQIEDPIRIR
jgi:hypothetical protein